MFAFVSNRDDSIRNTAISDVPKFLLPIIQSLEGNSTSVTKRNTEVDHQEEPLPEETTLPAIRKRVLGENFNNRRPLSSHKSLQQPPVDAVAYHAQK